MNKDILNNVSRTLGISPDVIEKVYKAYWLYIKTTIEALPLKDNLNEEEFLKLRTNFNITSIGKLYCNLDKYNKIKRRFNIIDKLRNAENKILWQGKTDGSGLALKLGNRRTGVVRGQSMLQAAMARFAEARSDAAIIRAAGKPAPPRPRREAASSASSSRAWPVAPSAWARRSAA